MRFKIERWTAGRRAIIGGWALGGRVIGTIFLIDRRCLGRISGWVGLEWYCVYYT